MSGKMEIIAISVPLIDLNYMIYMLQYDSTPGRFKGTVKTDNRKLVISEESSLSSRSKIPPTPNVMMLVL
ncbi:Glyceraldehyde-3-phosphate dehydrogenase, partial [Sigmodon hispidus]